MNKLSRMLVMTTAFLILITGVVYSVIASPDLQNATWLSLSRWSDNRHAMVDEGELEAEMASQTLAQWLSAPFVFGSIMPPTVLGYIARLTLSDIDNTYQGLRTTANFIFML